ncbi:MAG TPA: M50 family metallopeptidase [Yaniella sp.]
MLEEIWQRSTSVQPSLPEMWVLAVGTAAVVLTWSPLGYRLVRHLATLLHEAGHAIVGVLVGRKLRGIRLHSDTSGLTVSRGKPTGPGMVAALLAGYPAPAVVGLAGAWLVSAGYAAGMLWALVLLCALMLVFIRNFYGLWVILVTGVGVAVLSWTASAEILSITAYLMVWSLLLVAPRAVVELQRSRRRQRSSTSSDADQLARLTRIPAGFWIAVFWLICAGCLVLGGWFLLDAGG